MKHIVVIGGGFAGLMALKQLVSSKNLKLTLINNNDFFLFTPRLTELLNESVNENIVIKSIKDIFRGRVNFVRDHTTSIDFKKRYIETKRKKLKINYDYLVMSQGATTNFFGNKNIEKNTIDCKNYNDVLKIKNKIKNNVNKYVNNKKELLTFAVIGAGLTGIELIFSLRETVLKEIEKYPDLKQKDTRFMLIQGEKIIVPQLPEKVRLKIEKHLKKRNIEIMTNTRVENIKNSTIVTKNKKIKAGTIIWTAGIKANTIKTNPKLDLEKGKKIKVNAKLKIPDYGNVYVGGDASSFKGKPLAATAQTAFQEGIIIGNNILNNVKGKPEKDFHYSDKGTLIVLGSKHGIFIHKNITFDGILAWYFRDLAYRIRFRQIT